MPHDVPRLIAKMGGDEKFVARLDQMFESKEAIVNFSEDVIGLIGMYAHGNEPCHHYAYLYTYAGQPWKTQARIRQICNALYNNTTAGMCGNDDCGQMSAWYVFSALGFYPADPCGGIYVLGSPLVDQATMHLAPPVLQGWPVHHHRREQFPSEHVHPVGDAQRQAADAHLAHSRPDSGRRHAGAGDGAGAEPGVGSWRGGSAEIGARYTGRAA